MSQTIHIPTHSADNKITGRVTLTPEIIAALKAEMFPELSISGTPGDLRAVTADRLQRAMKDRKMSMDQLLYFAVTAYQRGR